ncbi:MAG TPA: outer membrane lipoprotein-sorting protein [Candidatus Sulfotelmatobacter sp.]|nr:outer membrane lipoprotein-sorting protein [Candidatus Sulfotelmatobacter sp.]
MNRLSLILTLAMAAILPVVAPAQQSKPGDPAALDAVLKKMDAVAANFSTAQADFEWVTYQKVIDEVVDVERGVIYYRKSNKQIEMMAEVKRAGTSESSMKSEPKFVLLSGGKIRLYQPKMDQITEFDLGKNQTEFESYIVLGFGASGEDLQKNFEVKYAGPETINGVNTAKLQLVPKSAKVKNTYSQILLWIDLERGVSVQQQLFQPQGDYRLAKYSQIKLHEKVSDDVFKLKTTGKTQTVTPHG